MMKIIKIFKRNIDIYSILFLVLLGGFLRFFLVTKIPCGLYPDQAIHGLDAIRFAEGHLTPVFGTNEGLFAYLVALSHFLFGYGIWQIFIVSAFIGSLTIVATYYATKELFDRKIAFLTTFFLSVSSWHIALSRSGFRAILVPLIIALIGYFWAKSVRSETVKEKTHYYTITAATVALGFYTYNAYPLFAFALAVIFAMHAVMNWKNFMPWILKNKKIVMTACSAFLIIFLPFALFMTAFHQSYFERANQVSIFSQSENAGEIIKFIIKNFWDTFQGIFVQGDLNWRHNPAGQPLLFTPVSALLIVGLLYALITKEKKYKTMIALFFVMFLPAVLTNDGIPPHGLRLVGIIPFLFFFPALAVSLGMNKLKTKSPRIIGFVFLLLLMIANTTDGYKKYFTTPASSSHYYNDFRCDLTKVARYIKENKEYDMHVIVDDFSFQTIRYLLSPETVRHVTPEVFLKNFEREKISGNRLIIPNSYGEIDEEIVKKLSHYYYPEIMKNSFNTPDFYIFAAKPLLKRSIKLDAQWFSRLAK